VALTLSALHIYPVKGLKGIDLADARCTERGLENDRRWMVVDAEGEFISQRSHPKMATVWTDLADGALTLSAPDVASVDVPLDPRPSAPTRVRVWESVCDALPVSAYADAWLSDYLGLACRLVYMPETTRRLSNPERTHGEKLVGFADGYAYLVTTEASLADLNTRLAARGARSVPMNRFGRTSSSGAEMRSPRTDGGKIRVGEAVLEVAKPCGRCQVTTTDQATGEVTGPEPLATLGTFRSDPTFGACFGVNLVTVKPGIVRVGDEVQVS
jgi:uncharacterized protein YcbX